MPCSVHRAHAVGRPVSAWPDPWQLIIAQFAVPGVALVSALQLFLTGVRKNLRTAMALRKTDRTIVYGIGDVDMQVIQNLASAGHHG